MPDRSVTDRLGMALDVARGMQVCGIVEGALRGPHSLPPVSVLPTLQPIAKVC